MTFGHNAYNHLIGGCTGDWESFVDLSDGAWSASVVADHIISYISTRTMEIVESTESQAEAAIFAFRHLANLALAILQ